MAVHLPVAQRAAGQGFARRAAPGASQLRLAVGNGAQLGAGGLVAQGHFVFGGQLVSSIFRT